MVRVASLGMQRPASLSGHFGGLSAAFVLVAALLLVLLAPGVGYAAVSISRAEVDAGTLWIEGTAAPKRVITVDGIAMGSSNRDGRFRVERTGYTAPADCTVDVNDGSATAAVAVLAGCTTDPSPSPSPSTCTIVPQTFGDGNVGTLSTWYFTTTGCRTSEQVVQFSVVAGQIPPGTTLFTQGVSSGGITGTPTTEGLFSFTIRARDYTGATDTESFSIRINPPRPLVITNQSDTLSPGIVGEYYCCGNLFADGGVPGYTWSLRSGQLPPGLSLTTSPGRITGTPTTTGTFPFLMRVTDSVGTFTERTFSITIS